MSDSCEDDYESFSEFCDRMGYGKRRSEHNPPTLCRPQFGKGWSNPRILFPHRNEPSKHNNDALYGIVLSPEYSILITNEKSKKLLTRFDKLKMKIASFILWLANRIGDKNV